MRVVLKDFQIEAVDALISSLSKMRRRYLEDGELSSVCLSAPTGSGKTVMCAAAIESLFFGNTEMGYEPDDNAVVLWLSDSPALNEQTLARFVDASDKLADWIGDRRHLEVIENNFGASHEYLEPRHVYFLSKALLSKTSNLTKGGELNSGRVFWDILDRTIRDPERNLYLFIDEAHRGLGSNSSSNRGQATIYSNLIDGLDGRAPMPIVVGVSATPQRFVEAMGERSNRIMMPVASVSPTDVQESGLLKDTIVLRVPEKDDPVEHQYLTVACKQFVEMEERWDDYCREQNEPKVSPLLLIQTADNISPSSLKELCDQISGIVPNLNPSTSFANVFGDHKGIQAGHYLIPYIEPEFVQQRPAIRVLFAKEAISNGWDCPRAEVVFSQRRRSDSTYIAQLIGRMVRTPLARRIDSDDLLNSVACYLPRFNPENTRDVVDYLTGKKDDLSGTVASGGGQNVIVNPVRVEPAVPKTRADYEAEVKSYNENLERLKAEASLQPGSQARLNFEQTTPQLETEGDPILPGFETMTGGEALDASLQQNASVVGEPNDQDSDKDSRQDNETPAFEKVKPPTPLTKRNSSFTAEEWAGIYDAFKSIPVRRYPKKARNEFRALLDTASLFMETGLSSDAGQEVNDGFVGMLSGALLQHSKEYKASRHEIEVAETRRITIDKLHGIETESSEELLTDSEGIEKAAREAEVVFGGKEFINAYKKQVCLNEHQSVDEANLQLAAAVRTPSIVADLEEWARSKRKDFFDSTAADRDFLSERNMQRYDELERESSGKRLKKIEWPTGSYLSDNYEKYPKHIVQKEDGLCPLNLNKDEKLVVKTELGRKRTVAFYRNPSNFSERAFSIPYYSKEKGRMAIHPDFIFFVRDIDGNIRPTIVDIHGEFLSDTLAKLVGYVNYLREFPSVFAQVLFIGDLGGSELRGINLLRRETQDAVLGYRGVDCQALFRNEKISFPYMY